MELSQISALLKREYPMLFIDGVTDIDPWKMCNAYKNVTYNEWFFPAHFPDEPVMPGTFQIEAFTQAVALPLLVAGKTGDVRGAPVLLGGVDKARFYRSVYPGDRFDICARIDRIAMGMATATASGSVRGEMVSECKIIYKLTGENKNGK